MIAEVTISDSVTIEVTIDGSAVLSPTAITGQTITVYQPFVVDTEQSARWPSIIHLFDENGKRIDKNMGEPTVSLDTTYKITYAAQAIPYSNVTLYWL